MEGGAGLDCGAPFDLIQGSFEIAVEISPSFVNQRVEIGDCIAAHLLVKRPGERVDDRFEFLDAVEAEDATGIEKLAD